MIAIARLDAAIRAASIPIDGVSGAQGAVRIDFKAAATAQQQTQAQAIVTAFDWSPAADAAADAQVAKASAIDVLDNGNAASADATRRVVWGVVQLLRDELNIHSTFEADLLAAIAAATSLGNLQTRVAAITSKVPQRTAQQVRDAIAAKINTTGQ